MLLRVLVATEAPDLHRRILRLMPRSDAALSPSRPLGLWEGLARESFDLVVVDRAALPEPAGDVIATIRRLPDRPEVVVLQGSEDPRDRAALHAAGCLAVVSQHLPDRLLGETLGALVDRRREELAVRLRAERGARRERLSDSTSDSPAMQEVLDLARRVAAADSSLLLLGETGVGKEWLARAIHGESPRAAAPFLAINCAAIPDPLLESELFGHEKGAFTGAVRSRRGSFELAHGGTVFLDEIGDMSPHLQAKLLRFLQERTIQRVGGERLIELDVRIMAATNREFEQALAAREFRPDLYYRLGVVSLLLPPLRQRREDIPALIESYLGRFQTQLGGPARSVAPAALAALVEYPWPGNVRELINVVERAVLLCQRPEFTLDDLPAGIAGAGPPAGPARPSGPPPAAAPAPEWLEKPLRAVRREFVRELERAYLEGQLRRTRGRIAATAERAGIAPRSLFQKMKELGLRKEDYRSSGGAR